MAQHELIHGIGFLSGYARFQDHLGKKGDKPVVFEKNDKTGAVLAVMLSADPADETHIDPEAGKVGELDQAKGLMQPKVKVGARMGAQEKAVLNAIYQWQDRDLFIKPVFLNAFAASEKKEIEAAAVEAMKLFGNAGMKKGHVFEWNVKVNPIPLPAVLLAGVLGAFGYMYAKTRSRRPEEDEAAPGASGRHRSQHVLHG